MKYFYTTLIFAALAFSTGCVSVTSLQPLFPDDSKQVKFDPSLLGKWQTQDSDKDVFEVTRLDRKAYAVTFEADGKPAKATFHFVKSHDLSLLDVVYTDNRGPEHTFLKIRIEPDMLWVGTADSQWLRDQIVTRGTPSYTAVREDNLLLTAPSAELRRTLLPYLARPEAYEEETELKRVR